MGNDYIVEYIMSRNDVNNIVSSKNKSDIWELLGCSLIDRYNDVDNGIKYWKKALDERNNNNNNNNNNNKIIQQKISPWKKEAYGEILINNNNNNMTLQEYKNIISKRDNIFIKSLIIREKILGSVHEVTKYYIKERGRYYLKKKFRNIDRCIRLWTYYIYASQNQKNRTFSKNYKASSIFYRIWRCTEVIRNHISEFDLSYMINIFEKLILKEFELIILFDQFCYNVEYKLDRIARNMYIAIQFIYLLLLKLKQQPYCNDYYYYYLTIRNLVRKLVLLNPRGYEKIVESHYRYIDGLSLLHIVCWRSPIIRKQHKEPPNVELVELFLDAGCNPCVEDYSGCTPLHYIAFSLNNKKYIKFVNTWRQIVLLLLKYGAHIDAVNVFGNTFTSLQDTIYLNSTQYTSLQCLSAIAVKKYEERGYKYVIPKHLLNFINMHYFNKQNKFRHFFFSRTAAANRQ